jgi:hypothetical protein
MYEIILKSVFDVKFGGTSSTDVTIFKRFQEAWKTIHTNKFNFGIHNNILMNSVKYIYDNITLFSKDRLKDNHPRDDYQE